MSSENKISFLTAFNNQLENMLDDLVNVFPEELEFSWLKDGIALVRKTNPRIVLNEFSKMVIPYKESILNRDENFFLEKDYHDDFKTVNSDYVSKLTFKIKGLWGKMNENNRVKLWEYFESLITLGELASK